MARQPLVVAAGALVALVLAACGGGGGGDPRPDLLLVSTRDGPYAIVALDADGTNQKRLTEAEVDLSSVDQLFFQIEPDWSPDGRRVAFSSTRRGNFDVFVMAADGTQTQRLVATDADERHPTWSPDGSRIAYERSATDIYVVDVDGGEPRALTDASASESQPAWSPDGEWIAYARREPGSEAREIWVIRPDGSDARRLTSLRAMSIQPAWSPDSRKIAFASNAVGPLYDVYLLTVGKKGVERLTRAGGDAFEPAWAPDGSLIAFSQDGAIATVDLDGTVDVLTDEDDNDSAPAWNPVPRPVEEESG